VPKKRDTQDWSGDVSAIGFALSDVVQNRDSRYLQDMEFQARPQPLSEGL
jgi:hypothetical protein